MTKTPEEIAEAFAAKQKRQMEQAHEFVAPDLAGRKAMAILARDGVVTLDGLIAEVEAGLRDRPAGDQGFEQACLKHLLGLRERRGQTTDPG